MRKEGVQRGGHSMEGGEELERRSEGQERRW